MVDRKQSMEIQVLIELRKQRSFSEMSSETLSRLAHFAVIKTCKKNDYVWNRGESGGFCALILEGVIEISKTTSEGVHHVVGLFGPGDVIGLSAMLGKKNFPADAQVASRTAKVIRFYLRSVREEFTRDGHEDISRWQREMLIAHEQILREKIDIMSSNSVFGRLRNLFRHLVERFGEVKGKEIIIQLGLSKTQIAHIIEFRVETVIKALNQWEREGLLSMSRSGIVLHEPKKII